MHEEGDHGRRLTSAERLKMQRRISAGEGHASVAAALECSTKSVQRLLLRTGGLAARARPRSLLRLSLAEREEISRGLEAGASCRTIAGRLGRAPSTVSRGPSGGWARAVSGLVRRRHRGAPGPPPQARQARGLPAAAGRRRAAPGAALERRADRPPALARPSGRRGDARVARDHLPLAVRAGPRGTASRTDEEPAHRPRAAPAPATAPRARRAARHGAHQRPSARSSGPRRPGSLGGRPHPRPRWPLGRGGRSALGTLVERRTRLTLLLALPQGRTAAHVRRALTRRIRSLPAQLRRTLTWDRGKEMAEHVRFSVESGVQVYFCDPRSPWQRATSENTNGLLRQYFPKGSDLAVHRQAQLDAVARELNGRPRRTLDWKTPAEAFAEVVR